MNNSRPVFTFRWFYLPLGYVLLLLASFLFQVKPTENISNIGLESSFADSTNSVIVLFKDPLVTENQWHKELSENYEILTIPITAQSFEQNARLASRWIDSMGVTAPYHVVGEGIGGSIAMHFTIERQDSIASLVLISSFGIEELELLGGFNLNHAIYRARTWYYRFLKFGVPHFGLAKNLEAKLLCARIQLQSDQRKIRPLLGNIQVPVLIQHMYGGQVSKELSREHHRLLPQSELVEVQNDQEQLRTLLLFFEKVESKKAMHRNQVPSIAENQSHEPFDPANSIKAEGKLLFIFMLVIILSTFITEDLTCIGTGLMVARGLIGFIPGTVACLLGIFFGDILLYLAGRWLAAGTLHKAPLKWFISEKDIQLSYHWFQAKGPAIIIASRFIPGSRFPTYFSAGAIGANFWMFIFYFAIASLVWTPILVGLSAKLGQQMLGYFSVYQDYALWILIGLFAALYVIFKIIIPSFTFKGRRLLVGKFKRFVNWEFWSPWVVYFPVLLYTTFLWLKYRSITLVTLVNPGIPFGGLINESKSQILDQINAKERVAAYLVVKKEWTIDEKLREIRDFMYNRGLVFPIVLKPDVGQRGAGVSIPKNMHQLELQIKAFKDTFIVQEYVDGVEFGVFYYRFPKQEKGHIFSITQKNYMWLEGDGVHTLEELILKDPRAVCMAEKHFEQHIDELYHVPVKGKKIKLVEVGSHARGAIFSDAIHLKTKFLEEEIDRISKSFDGFYFGRFDIKAPSIEHFKEANELKILELNGLTSEATHIYDKKYRFWMGVWVLISQWKLAYEIAHQVKEMYPELEPPSIRSILTLFR